jgi:hypothetical protein
MLWRWLAAGLSLFICSGGARADAVAGIPPVRANALQ